MFNFLRRETCTLHIEKQDNGTSKVVYPDCTSELLIRGEECAKNPSFCYKRIAGSLFFTTNHAIQVYKKTRTVDKKTHDVTLTTLIIPADTQIHSENGIINDEHKCRAEEAWVLEHKDMCKDREYDLSVSIFWNELFEYKKGERVIPEDNSFYSYDVWVKNNENDATCEAGIHYFNSETAAYSYTS